MGEGSFEGEAEVDFSSFGGKLEPQRTSQYNVNELSDTRELTRDEDRKLQSQRSFLLGRSLVQLEDLIFSKPVASLSVHAHTKRDSQ
jgi:hypothetical protein